MRNSLTVFASLVTLASSATFAAAPEPSPAASEQNQTRLDKSAEVADRPWARGVSEEKQKSALELFKLGNAALRESLWVKAASTYREALALWDHPAIHYNLALALVNLDQPVETHEHLLAALKYGAAPLDSDKFDQANRYKALVEKQLSRLEVTCAVEGAIVKLDGRELFVAPGKYEGMERSGPHTLIASKEGFITNEQSRNFPAGEVSTFDLKLLTAEEATEYRRLWPAAVPWVVLGAGVAVAGAGAAMHLVSRDTYANYDIGVKKCADAAGGTCIPTPELTSAHQRADSLQGLAIASYGVGGAAIVTGAILVYVNRLQPYHLSTEVKAPEVTVAPMFGPGGTGAMVQVSF